MVVFLGIFGCHLPYGQPKRAGVKMKGWEIEGLKLVFLCRLQTEYCSLQTDHCKLINVNYQL